MCRVSIRGEPAYLCRMITRSHAIAESVSAVSASDSPLTVAEVDAEKFSPSAERRLAAISKLVRVRVLGLEEEVDDGAAAQRRQLLDAALVDLLEGVRGVEDQRDVLGREVLDVDDVARGQHLRLAPFDPLEDLGRVATVRARPGRP